MLANVEDNYFEQVARVICGILSALHVLCMLMLFRSFSTTSMFMVVCNVEVFGM